VPNGEGSHRWPEGDLSNPRWQGAVETQLNGLEDWVRDLDRKRDQAEKDMTAMRVQVAQLRTQVGVWSAVGGLLGAGIVSGLITSLGGH
jgi:hypothetical protein